MNLRVRFFILVSVALCCLSGPLQAQWVTQPTGTTQNLRGLVMLDTHNGWAVGASSTLLNTTDGKSWQANSTGVAGNYNAITFDITGIAGWIAGDMPQVISTTDLGLDWIAVPSGTTNALNSIQFLNSGVLGWAVGNAGTIVASNDGGLSWHQQQSGVTANLNSVVFLGEEATSIGFAVGDKGTLLSTVDNGATWQKRPLGTDRNLNAIDMFDPNNGIIVGDQIILRTTDGGANWTNEVFSNPTVLHTINMLDTANAFAAGAGGRILKTTNGKTWVDQGTNTTQTLYALQFQGSNDSGWAAGDHGTILFNGAPLAVAHSSMQNSSLRLEQNFPNPFSVSTTFTYYLPQESEVRLSIYDKIGRLVTTLVSTKESAGAHHVAWNIGESGQTLTLGLYFCRLEVAGTAVASKIMLSK